MQSLSKQTMNLEHISTLNATKTSKSRCAGAMEVGLMVGIRVRVQVFRFPPVRVPKRGSLGMMSLATKSTGTRLRT